MRALAEARGGGSSRRSGSNSSGRSTAPGSRCAAASQQQHGVALGDRARPPIVMSSPAIRPDQLHRRVVAQRLLDHRRRPVRVGGQRRPLPRLRSIASIALAIRLTVVSCPAISSRLQVATISSSVSWSPSSSAGSARRSGRRRGSRRRRVDRGRAGNPAARARPACAPRSRRRPSPVTVMNGSSDLGQQRRGRAELRLVLERHAEQPADHRDRQRVGQIGDGVERARRCRPSSSSPSTSRDDVGLERLDHLGHERLADQAAAAGCGRAGRGTGTPAARTAARSAPSAIARWATVDFSRSLADAGCRSTSSQSA